MSASNSNTDKQHAFEQPNGDREAYLDSLIAQFDDELEVALDEKAESKKSATAEPEKSPSQNSVEKSGKPTTNPGAIIIPLIAAITVAILGGTGWLALEDSSETHTTVEAPQPETATETTHQPEALKPSLPLKAAVPEPAAPPALTSKQEPTSTHLQVAPSSATAQHPNTDPVSYKATTPEQGSSGMVWAVNLASIASLDAATQIKKGLDSRGIKTELIKVTVGKKSFYRIRIPGFSNKKEADRARLSFLKEREFGSAWVASYHK